MPDNYQLPAILLTALLLPPFAQLYWRSREPRTLLWLLAFLFALVRMGLFYRIDPGEFSHSSPHSWLIAAGLTIAQISFALFLASLSPLSLPIGRFRIHYSILFILPLIAYDFLLYGRYHGVEPGGFSFLIFPTLGALSLFVACFWALAKGSLPTRIGLGLCIALGGAALWVCVSVGGAWPMLFVECAVHFTLALLLLFLYHRISPGTLLSAAGFFAWSLHYIVLIPRGGPHPAVYLAISRFASMGVVVAALGMILIALEDQLALRENAQDREHRARKELESYTRLTLSRRRVEDFDRQAGLICQTVVANSRFAKAALLLAQPSGQFRLAGAAGLDDASLNSLEALTLRIPAAGFLAPGSAPSAAPHSHSFALGLEAWLLPGDDLQRLHLTGVIATPLHGRAETDGALFLAELRNPKETLHADDLLPVEVLASRIQAARSQTLILEKLIENEKFAGLGQLAGSITRQFNNPLTVILGYASLLEASDAMSPQERKGVEAILTEARNMRSTLESLSRMSHTQTDHFSAISVTELLGDLEQLHRSEFVHRSIDFRLHVMPALPRALGNAQQVRQAVLYCLQFAIEAVENLDSPNQRSVRIEASTEEDRVKILIAHSGPGFLHPTRAFDPFVPAEAVGETAGLGLSLCATILRENNGRISAINYEPRGAAILLELQAA